MPIISDAKLFASMDGEKWTEIIDRDFRFIKADFTFFGSDWAERWPHMVNYHRGKCYYTDPSMFFGAFESERSPSDCTWIVPGTTP